jgi:hypothetical protein
VAGTLIGDFIPVVVWTAHNVCVAKAGIYPANLF